jgi:hypothetical protein
MRLALRIIGIATTIFWIILIAFIATAAYSVKDVSFNIGETEVTISPDGTRAYFRINITIVNGGLYNVGSFNLTTEAYLEGFLIAHNSTLIEVIRTGENVTATHTMRANIARLPQPVRDSLSNSTDFEVNAFVSLNVAEMIPVQASTNFTVPIPTVLRDYASGSAVIP